MCCHLQAAQEKIEDAIMKAWGHDHSEEAQAVASESDGTWSRGEAVVAGDATKGRAGVSLLPPSSLPLKPQTGQTQP